MAVQISTDDLPSGGHFGSRVATVTDAKLETIISYDNAIRGKRDNIRLMSDINILLAEDKELLDFPLLDLNALLFLKKVVSCCSSETMSVGALCDRCKSFDNYSVTVAEVGYTKAPQDVVDIIAIRLGSKEYEVKMGATIKEFAMKLTHYNKRPLPIVILATIIPSLPIDVIASATGNEAFHLQTLAHSFMMTMKTAQQKCRKCGGAVEVDVNSIPFAMFRLQQDNLKPATEAFVLRKVLQS